MRFWRWLILFGLAALAISLVLNYVLYERGRAYYLQLNELRLDPLGLSYYRTETPTADDRLRMMFYGDSRAAGWPPPTSSSNLTFINRGIGSQTTVQILQRFDVHVQPSQPDIILIQAGVNDLKTLPLFPGGRDWIVSQTQANLQRLVEASREIGARVILTTIFPVGEVPLIRRPFWSADVDAGVDEVNAFIETLAADDVIVFDTFDLLADTAGKLRAEYAQDELHLNSAGYGLLNAELAKILATFD